jgi:hypothetical protein
MSISQVSTRSLGDRARAVRKRLILALGVGALTVAAGEPHMHAGERFSFVPLAEAAMSSALPERGVTFLG